MDPHPIIEVDGVGKFRGDREVLKRVSFSVRAGEFFSVLGPSGCGKTTLLRLISGLDQPDSGEIRVEGKSLRSLSLKDQKILLVFQNFALFPHLTVAQNVGFGLKLKGVPRRQIDERVAYYLDVVKLSSFASRLPSQLSGGQQQRVAIARALAPEPAAVLFDEPLGALDQKLRREMQFELKNLQERLKTTFIYVTHDQEEALTLSDRVALMNHGKIVQMGSPLELYNSPSSSFTAQFIGDNNAILANVVAIENDERRLQLQVGATQIPVELPSPASLSGFKVGGRAKLFIRPEHLSLAVSKAKVIAPEEFYSLDCEAMQQLFVGREALVHLQAESQALIAKVPADQSYKQHKKMRCYWRRSQMHAFAAEEGV